ncbi:antibiotic biosynthesis monooxygenase family protein [Agaribacterium haliotis]|uniref:antibiotic biosynthesis monooxygenase family protein n=1 Tax=Agaribacterium haliotis TaxID=2013869 RepID=UPI000BB574C2|nr:antibiotic biosynthesis monooxygenase family protein [Agaribacterium haliotis]
MIHVLIERELADGMVSTYEQLLKGALRRSFVVSGFIAGEAYSDIDNPHKRILWCKWRSLEDWQRWFHSEERDSLLRQMRPMLIGNEKITVLEH